MPGKERTVKLDLSEIARTPGAYAEHEIDMTFKEIEGMKLTAPVRGKMIVSSTGRVLILEGAVDTEVELLCYRCGIAYHQPVHAAFQEDFVVHSPQPHGPATRIEEDDEAPESRLFYEGSLDLNLDELLRQSILVALPLKPLCADDCRGLCPHCGHRLEEGSCACQPHAINPKLAVLRQLLEHRQQKGS
jgi:uncharacterized protein